MTTPIGNSGRYIAYSMEVDVFLREKHDVIENKILG